ncbi:flagellar hook-associated protein FlgK [Ramlibacter sp.]|uniref:flagellar hook-associated protein FlgK n=1 Tax=Ramlibacter sp. TaxID=1917967 RepID=UPI003D09A934
MGSLLNIGTSALAAAQGSLTTISHNIANANTEGYSRQRAQLSTAGGLATGAGFFGRGVDLSGVQRQYDQFLTQALQGASAASASDAARAEGLRALDAVFAGADQGIGVALDELFGAAGDLANRPGDASARQVFIARVSAFSATLTAVGQRVADVASSADAGLALRVPEVNSRLSTIRRLNEQIARGGAGGQPPNDLLDQRDAEVQALSQSMAVQTVAQGDGSISLFLRSGAPLLVGSQQAQLVAAPDPSDPSCTGLRLESAGAAQWLDAAALGGGSLAGLMRVRDDDAARALREVGRIATVAASALNAQHAQGIDMDGAAGQALLRVPSPRAVPAAGNTSGGAVSCSVVNAAALQSSDYEVAFDNGNWTIMRTSDGRATSASSLPATVDGLAFGFAGTPAAGDTWLVRPFDAAATGLSALPLGTRQIATGAAGSSAPGSDNRNALALASLATSSLIGGQSLGDTYATLLAEVGSRVQAGVASETVSMRLRDDALARQQTVSGVNLDEEASDLLRFQQAYQASARIVQASQSLFEALLAATGR